MRLVLTIAALISIYTPAAAFSPCDDLWFTRNLLFARNGYCFASPLGQAVFGNAGCFTNEPGLDGQERDVLADVRDREKALECHVDNQRQRLDVDLIEQRKQMLDLPYDRI
ncbi:YARHG domain-containing protein [Profundibacter sp.]|uniref:YARHG domain-containing protein n=1 Tax=Profundibacter sp. TaxID=3101071 RepID=UPI003D0B153B